MRTYSCSCGNVIYFDNHQCLACGNELGFCPKCRQLTAILPIDGEPGHFHCGHADCRAPLAKCFNYSEHHVCNRCVALPAAEEALCDCCRFNVTIPDLSVEGNWEKWYRLEAAKRRLFYDLGELGLPYGTAEDGIRPSLGFDFKADSVPAGDVWRAVSRTEKVYTGHAAGRVTINIREADEVEREKLRIELGEAQRTLIGHFRHEIGHFYWDALVKGRREAEFKTVFGDHEKPTYAEALDAYYQAGPPADWAQNYISPYATMHPWEDFAETWAAYLDLVSVLDTAEHHGLDRPRDPLKTQVEDLVARYQQLGISLNEINRAMGLIDLVPEVFAPPVIQKLRYVQHLVQLAREENGALKPPAPASAGPASAATRVSKPPTAVS